MNTKIYEEYSNELKEDLEAYAGGYADKKAALLEKAIKKLEKNVEQDANRRLFYDTETDEPHPEASSSTAYRVATTVGDVGKK